MQIGNRRSTGHRITKNNRLTHLGEMPGVRGQFDRVDGFSPAWFTCKKLICRVR